MSGHDLLQYNISIVSPPKAIPSPFIASSQFIENHSKGHYNSSACVLSYYYIPVRSNNTYIAVVTSTINTHKPPHQTKRTHHNLSTQHIRRAYTQTNQPMGSPHVYENQMLNTLFYCSQRRG